MQYREGLVALNNGSTVASNYILAGVQQGSLSEGTYYYVLSVVYPAGESVKSVEKSIYISGNIKGVQISWSAVNGALKYRIYRGTSSGSQNVFFETTDTTFIDTGATGQTGTPLTSSDVAQYVVGYETKFLSNVSVGSIFKKAGEDVTYQVALVISDTLLKLNAFYAGEGSLGAEYQIVRDFTPNLGLTEIWAGDADWAYHLTEGVIRKLDYIVWVYAGLVIKARATETLSSNSLVNLYYANNQLCSRKADATSQYIANGFVDKLYSSNEIANVILYGAIKNLSNLNPGNYYFLGNNGSVSDVSPEEGVIQIVGYAVSPTVLIFNPQVAIYIEE